MMIRILFRLAVLFLFCFTNAVYAFEKGLSFHHGGANTPNGELIINKFMRQVDEILLNGKTILRGDDDHFSWFVSSAYPRTGLASLVLLSFDTGDNSCKFLHRVMELLPDGQYRLSPEFGNCREFEDSGIAPYENAKEVNPKFINGEWRLGFRPYPKGKGKVWYSYRSGQIFKDGKKVEGPDLP